MVKSPTRLAGFIRFDPSRLEGSCESIFELSIELAKFGYVPAMDHPALPKRFGSGAKTIGLGEERQSSWYVSGGRLYPLDPEGRAKEGGAHHGADGVFHDHIGGYGSL